MTSAPAASLPRVVDASPLIGLAKVGHLDLLTAGGRSVLITATVTNEVLAGGVADPARRALEAGWGEQRADVVVFPPALRAWQLDAGEESTLALALALGAVAILDDGDGRRAARALGVLHTGAAGIVAEAKRLGLIPSAGDVLLAIRAAGVYLPPDAMLTVLLSTLGETWP